MKLAGPLVIALALALAVGVPAYGHHSISGQYDLDGRVTLRGVIARIDWINPHAYVYLDVPDTSGVTQWALATVPLAMMRKAGLTREMLAGRPGETVTVDALPGLNGTKQGWIVRITYADGHFYQLSGR